MIGIILKVIAAWLIGYLAGLRFFDTEDKPIWGMLIGIMFGLVIGAFGYCVLDSSGAESFSQYFAPVSLIYSGQLAVVLARLYFLSLQPCKRFEK